MPSQTNDTWWQFADGSQDLGLWYPHVHCQERRQGSHPAAGRQALDGAIVVRPENHIQIDAATTHEGVDLLDTPAFAKCDKGDVLKVCERKSTSPAADLRRIVMGDDDDIRVIQELDCLEGSIWERE